jgi:PEP-CTERM motif
MKTMMTKRPLRLAVLAVPLLLVAATVHAAPFLVTLDTSSLSGTQTLAFGLTNFDAASNTISLSAFGFGGGSAVAGTADCTLGGTFSGLGCSGDLTSGVVLQDLDPTAAFFTQQFNAGGSLSFVLTTTNNFAAGTPDQFAFFVCDGGLNTCYSNDASGALLRLDLVGGSLFPSSFDLFGASLQNLDAPIVTAVPDQVPEPGTLLLLGSALAGVVARSRKGRAR